MAGTTHKMVLAGKVGQDVRVGTILALGTCINQKELAKVVLGLRCSLMPKCTIFALGALALEVELAHGERCRCEQWLDSLLSFVAIAMMIIVVIVTIVTVMIMIVIVVVVVVVVVVMIRIVVLLVWLFVSAFSFSIS